MIMKIMANINLSGMNLNAPVQIQEGPNIFCDASVCVQQSAAYNQTGVVFSF